MAAVAIARDGLPQSLKAGAHLAPRDRHLLQPRAQPLPGPRPLLRALHAALRTNERRSVARGFMRWANLAVGVIVGGLLTPADLLVRPRGRLQLGRHPDVHCRYPDGLLKVVQLDHHAATLTVEAARLAADAIEGFESVRRGVFQWLA
eukprot:5037973-Prymnesium_polylepis.1